MRTYASADRPFILKSPAHLTMLRWLVWRDLLLAWRRRSDALSTIAFFVIVAALFPLGVGADSQLLTSIAPGVLWIGALLASLLSLDRLFADDFADGSLEQLLTSPQPTYLIVLGKVIAQWLVSGVPLVLTAPCIALMYGLPFAATMQLVLSLLLGTPVLALVGSIGAALTLGLRGNGALIGLLVLPLYVPTLVFGANFVTALFQGADPADSTRLLAAMFILALTFVPVLTAAALRISVE